MSNECERRIPIWNFSRMDQGIISKMEMTP